MTVNRHPARLIRHQLSLTCALLLGAGLLAPAASAQRDCQAPPGRSAIEQYCEVLPSAGGDGPAGDRRGGSGRDALPRSVRRQLDEAGAAGNVIAGLVGGSVGADEARGGRSGDGRTGEGTGGRVSGDGNASSGGGTASSGGAPGEPSDNPLEAVRSAAEAGPSSGSALLWALAAATLLLVALAWLRHRRRPEPE